MSFPNLMLAIAPRAASALGMTDALKFQRIYLSAFIIGGIFAWSAYKAHVSSIQS
jgi:hypothetical protein